MKKYKSGAPFGFSLPRRLLALFLIFVLVLYAVGMAVAIRLGNNAFAEVRRTYETRVSALADQLDAELQRIQNQIYYTMLRADVQHMALVTPSMSFPDIYKNVSAVAELMYALQNSSGLLEKATIYFPLLGKYISSDGRFEAFSDEDRRFLTQYNENGGQEIVVATEKGPLPRVGLHAYRGYDPGREHGDCRRYPSGAFQTRYFRMVRYIFRRWEDISVWGTVARCP